MLRVPGEVGGAQVGGIVHCGGAPIWNNFVPGLGIMQGGHGLYPHCSYKQILTERGQVKFLA